jgi:hypothetical protein
MRPRFVPWLTIALFSCSDYGFSDGKDPWPGDDSGDPSGEGDADVDSDTDADSDTDVDMPPTTFLEDCNPDTSANFDGGEIYVKSWDRETDGGTLSAAEAGWYHLYDWSLAESGSSQTNEVSYLRSTNGRRPDGEPYHANCADEWIIDDFDNGGTPEQRIYAGTFWLEAGANDLTMIHYCPLERRGYCPQFHDTSDASSTCDSDGPNSVHFSGEGLCLVRVDLPEP